MRVFVTGATGRPVQPGLIPDLQQGHYFETEQRAHTMASHR